MKKREKELEERKKREDLGRKRKEIYKSRSKKENLNSLFIKRKNTKN
jgi:hypothetical protein